MPKARDYMKDPLVKKLFDSIVKDDLQVSPSMPKGDIEVHFRPEIKPTDDGLERRLKERRVPTTSKATGPNPKDIVGSTKASITKVSPIAILHCADAMMDGAGKYNPYNWRAKHVTTMNYLDAAIRHIQAYQEGQRCATDSGAHHLGHAMAGCAIVLDAEAHHCLIDDRPNSDGGKAYDLALAEVKAHEMVRSLARAGKLDVFNAAVFKTLGAKSGRIQGKKRNKSGQAKRKKKLVQTT